MGVVEEGGQLWEMYVCLRVCMGGGGGRVLLLFVVGVVQLVVSPLALCENVNVFQRKPHPYFANDKS